MVWDGGGREASPYPEWHSIGVLRKAYMKVLRLFSILCIATVAACASISGDRSSAALKELAPSGNLRLAIVAPTASSSSAARDWPPASRVAVDLGTELAKKLGVPLELVRYPSPADVTNAATLGAWDVAFLNVDREREKVVDFGPAYLLTELTYLVSAGSEIYSIAEVDRPGTRVAVIENTTTQRTVSKLLKHAALLHIKTTTDLYEMVYSRKADAVAASRRTMEDLAARLPGSRVLPGSIHSTAVAVAVPKNRPAVLAYVSDFLESAKVSGSVRRALDNAGLRDADIAPPSRRP